MTRRTSGHTHFWSMLAVGATVTAGIGTVHAQEGVTDAPPAVAETTTQTETFAETTTTGSNGGNGGNNRKRNNNKNKNKNARNKNNRARALPNTGGEPWLMAFGGLALAGSALLLRRKIDMA